MSCQLVVPEALPDDEPVLTAHHLHLEPSPRQVRAARRFVAAHLPDLRPDELDVLLLLTSELVTNAVIHARTPLQVGITTTPRYVLLTVHDLDLARADQQPYADREGGWGLGLVRGLAEAHALTRHPEGGKTAWARIERRASSRTASA